MVVLGPAVYAVAPVGSTTSDEVGQREGRVAAGVCGNVRFELFRHVRDQRERQVDERRDQRAGRGVRALVPDREDRRRRQVGGQRGIDILYVQEATSRESRAKLAPAGEMKSPGMAFRRLQLLTGVPPSLRVAVKAWTFAPIGTVGLVGWTDRVGGAPASV